MKKTNWPRILAFTSIGILGAASATAMICPEPVREIIFSQPEWSALSPGQQRILQPLAGKWQAMRNVERRKWLALAERYAKLSPAELKRMQQRMRDWSGATPTQRQAARQEYARIKTQPVQEKDKFAEAYRHYLESKAAAEAAAAAAAAAAESVAASPEATAEPKPEPQPLQAATPPGGSPQQPLWGNP